MTREQAPLLLGIRTLIRVRSGRVPGAEVPRRRGSPVYFLDRLREHLLDPTFRQIEGFPVGEVEDILALSDPPYFTACPNPFLGDVIAHHGKPYDPEEPYHSEPFALDVAAGKNDTIYMAHSYHTKVPHQAILRYILHYTQPGDLILDGFCGSGMTGVAASLCEDLPPDEKAAIEQEMPGVQWGRRIAILNDLSPAAAFIAHNYNVRVDVPSFLDDAEGPDRPDRARVRSPLPHRPPRRVRLLPVARQGAERARQLRRLVGGYDLPPVRSAGRLLRRGGGHRRRPDRRAGRVPVPRLPRPADQAEPRTVPGDSPRPAPGANHPAGQAGARPSQVPGQYPSLDQAPRRRRSLLCSPRSISAATRASRSHSHWLQGASPNPMPLRA